MAQQKATNTFTKGMYMDLNELDASNDVLVNALNATVGTFNGNEGALQNDMGNVPVGNFESDLPALLTLGYIPVGSVEYGGVIYVASVNPDKFDEYGNCLCEIGSMPSPDYSDKNDEWYNSGKLQYKYAPLKVGYVDGEDVDLVSGFFKFDLNHPVNMLAEQSFDGSVNLIINDGLNSPKLINTGFHVLANNTYEIIKRFGSVKSNTNRYYLDKGETIFNLETSLYKDTSEISNFIYNGTKQGGQLKVGNYVIYAITCDKDGNESDIIGESGVISIFKGTEGDPFSVNGGIENEVTDKAISLTLDNVDSCYNYIKIYYSRTTSANNLTATTLAYSVDKLFPVTNNKCEIVFTGFEDSKGIDVSDLNIRYFNADNAKAQVLSLNILFLGNIKENNQNLFEYDILRKISLKVIPQCVLNTSYNLHSDYLHYKNGAEVTDLDKKNSYYNSKFIYNTTGYHAGEIYRFGIVYIRQDNSLTSVFDVCGINNLSTGINKPNVFPDDIDDSKFFWDGNSKEFTSDFKTYNSKGVCNIDKHTITNITDIIGIKFNIPEDFIDNTLYKGYFFVRQKRIPTMLAQGYATNICEESFLPSINISKDGSCELTHDVTYTTENESGVKVTTTLTESNKLYLYESFASGAFLTNREFSEPWISNNFYPKRSTKKVTNTLKLVNNYRSRLFTLSDYTYQYLDKLLGVGPVSSFLEEAGNINKSYFQAPGYDNIEYVRTEKGKDDVTEEYLFVHYATPEKWDDNGYSDLSKGRTLLCTEDKNNTDVNLYIHGFKKTSIPFDKKNLYKIFIDVNEDDLSYHYTITTSDNCRLVEATDLKDADGNVIDSVYTWEKKGNTVNFLDKFCTVDSAYIDEKSVNNDNSRGYVLNTNPSKMGLAASKKGSYRYTEVLAMILSPDKTYNAGLGLEFYCDKTLNINNIYLYDGSDLYEPYCSFFGHAGNSWARSIDEIILALNLYIKRFESNGKESSDSAVMKDPTTPTFDGKYGLTNKTDEDELRIPLHTMEYGSYGVYCPECELDKAYYNTIFTGLKLKVLPITTPKLLEVEDNFKTRHYIYNNIEVNKSNSHVDCKAVSLAENVSLMALQKDTEYLTNADTKYWSRSKTNYFSTKASEFSEIGFKFVGGKSLGHNYFNLNNYSDSLKDKNYSFGKVNINAPFNIVRGIYGPYIGVCSYSLQNEVTDAEHSTVINAEDISDTIVGFYIPGYTEENMGLYFTIRIEDPTAYQAISNRFSVNNNTPDVCYRGDCYINWYTHRVNRNFNDTVAMYNDIIIDGGSFSQGFEKCFGSEYRNFDLTSDSEAATKFNIGDINAVLLGSWVTFPVRSTMNTALRSDDGSNIAEVLSCGHNKTFYPLNAMDAGGSYKISESDAFNVGFNKSGGERMYLGGNLEVWINTYYKNRIVYSNVKQETTTTNGHRVFLASHHKDYTDLYGEIVKLIDFNKVLLVVCEHGIFTVGVNEQLLVAEGNGSNVYLNTNNVLSPTINIVSSTYGSTWVESVILTPYGVFGIDEHSKKIWTTDGNSIKIISDNSVLKFLNDHLFVTNTLKIGNTNIKTHYNKYKNDVMFTLYDITLDENTPDLLWNLCYNINSSTWQTFYSWIPIDSQNIGNNYISLNIFKDNDNTHYFWKHGQSERVPGINRLLPTNWYGTTHPFEFEFIVKEGPDYHKIFENIQIISNKVEPESFHYEIVGLCYDFYDLKEDSYYCLELLKQAYSECTDTKLTYDKGCLEHIHTKYNPRNFGKQVSFPMYYARLDIKNLIYDNYKQFAAIGYDYNYLTGTEIVRNKQLDEYRLWNHVKAVDAGKYGLLRGNMRYLEDVWDVQINPIFYNVRNTTANMWTDGAPIFLNDIRSDNEVDRAQFPEEFKNRLYVDKNTYNKRKSIKLKDKYIKIRVRYTGNELAVISAIKTLYTISYS